MSETASPLPESELAPRRCDAVVIGASAGGVEALSTLVETLPADLHVPIFVVLHLSAASPSVLPRILERAGPLGARNPESGQFAEAGCIYVAPPDRHMTVDEGGRVLTSRGPKENGHRPAIDPLFRSAAQVYGARAACVVLTGTLDDGAAGAAAIHDRGGIVVVQDPMTAVHPSMPLSVLAATPVDYVLDIDGIASLICRLDSAEGEGGPLVTAEGSNPGPNPGDANDEGVISAFTCPECHGTLWELDEHGAVRFRCRVGHAFAPDALLAAQSDSLEAALWAAARALEEKADLAERLERRLTSTHKGSSARRFGNQAREARRLAAVVREVVEELDGTVPPPIEQAAAS